MSFVISNNLTTCNYSQTGAQIIRLKTITTRVLPETAARRSSSSGQGLDVETPTLFTGQKV